MKIKIFVICAFILCLSMFASAQEKAKKDDKMMKNDEKMSKKTTPEQALMDREQAAWKAIEGKRWDDFGNMLASDYVGMSGGELTDKASELAQVKQGSFSNMQISDMKVTWIDKDAAIVNSVVSINFIPPGGMAATTKARTTTVWKKSGKDWHVVYHTDSPMK